MLHTSRGLRQPLTGAGLDAIDVVVFERHAAGDEPGGGERRKLLVADLVPTQPAEDIVGQRSSTTPMKGK
jgi:hypothetical protein